VRYFLNALLGGYAGMILMGPRAPQAAARAGSPHSNRLITIRSSWLERALLSPYFMNYHAEMRKP
jgi:hypothetical protein